MLFFLSPYVFRSNPPASVRFSEDKGRPFAESCWWMRRKGLAWNWKRCLGGRFWWTKSIPFWSSRWSPFGCFKREISGVLSKFLSLNCKRHVVGEFPWQTPSWLFPGHRWLKNLRNHDVPWAMAVEQHLQTRWQWTKQKNIKRNTISLKESWFHSICFNTWMIKAYGVAHVCHKSIPTGDWSSDLFYC